MGDGVYERTPNVRPGVLKRLAAGLRGADIVTMNPVAQTPSPDLRVLAMSLSDTRQQIAAAGAAQAQGAPAADVILELSTAAQNLMSS